MKQKITLYSFAFMSVFVFSFGRLLAQSSQNSIIQFSSDEQVGVYASTIDTGNRVISVGYFTDSAYIQGTKQGFAGMDSFDAFIVCTDEAGNIAWEKTFGSQYSTWAMNVVCDNTGNYFVSGYFEKSFSVDGIPISSLGSYNDFLIKIDHNGKTVWGTSYAVPYIFFNNSSLTPMTCDANGNLYYNPEIFNYLKINNQTFSDNNTGYSSLLLKFDGEGNVKWGKILANKNGGISSETVDAYNHVYIGGGTASGKITWAGTSLPGATDTTSTGLFFAKLDANTGNMIWIQRSSGLTSYSGLSHLETGSNGTLYAAGFFGDTLTIQGKNYYATAHQYNGYQDGLALNFDTSGKILWLQHYGDPYEPEYPDGFCLDKSDNVYIGGTYDAPITLGSRTLFSTLARDCYVIRFDRFGNYLKSISSKAISNRSFTGMQGLMTDTHNKLFVTGSLNSQTNFGGDTLSCFGPTSSFIWGLPSTFTGIEPETQETNNTFELYPNPLNGNMLNVEMGGSPPKGSMEISCLDETGKLIFSKSLESSGYADNRYSIQIPFIKPGLYFLRVVSKDGINVQKFIKN